MKRYFIVEEFFGIRVYDSESKKEFYFDSNSKNEIKKLLANQYNFIDNKTEGNKISAPLKISMNLTKKCNLRCIQCFSESGDLQEPELTTEEIYSLFDDMNRYGTFYICLGGGEPFTRKDLFDILKYGKNKQLAISIVSNGLLLNREKLEELNEMDLDYLWVSFEGMKENHEKLRGLGTFDKLLNKLALIQKYYKGKTALRMSINKYNIDEIESLVKIAEYYDVDLIRFTPLLEYGRATGKDLVIDQEQYINFLYNVKRIKSEKVTIIYPNMQTSKLWTGTNGFGCHCGKEAIWLDEVGNLSPCIFWGEKYNIGNIKNESYMELWQKNLEKSEIKGNPTCESCKNYTVCRAGCRARSLYEFGNLDEVDPLCPLVKTKVR